jgi:glycosyltransferase involved in cell wall biosynthesis
VSSHSPRVSVVMSVYNGEKHLSEAIESVLYQTMPDFEFVIVNDGSTDRTVEVVNGFNDSRIRLIDQDRNEGVAFSASRACKVAVGTYIARLDADDVCSADRLAVEVEYLDAHPDIGVVGSWVEYVDANGAPYDVWRTPLLPGVVHWDLLFGTCIANPTSMIRRTLMRDLGYYDVALRSYGEDYDFWARASDVTRLANIGLPLVKRRVWTGAIGHKAAEKQEDVVRKVMRSMIERRTNLALTDDDIASLRLFTTGEASGDLRRTRRIASLLPLMHRAFVKRVDLTEEERYTLSLETARKLCVLARGVRLLSRRTSASLVLRGSRIDPRPFHVLARKGLRKLVS